MTNAELIQKIRAEIERLRGQLIRGACAAQISFETSCKDEAYNELLSFLDTLESEKPMNLDDAMKELDEKIAIVKQRGTWKEVDVDKYMDEVRGREPEKPMNLEEEVKRYYSDNFEYISSDQPTLSILTNVARHFAQWQKEQYHFFNNAWAENMQAELDRNYENGKQAMKEQMMKEAVEGEVENASFGIVYLRKNLVNEGHSTGDKVRIIIVKEDEK